MGQLEAPGTWGVPFGNHMMGNMMGTYGGWEI